MTSPATHAQTVREALETLPEMSFTERNPEGVEQARDSMRVVAHDGIAALDALVALAEQLRGALDDAHTAAMDFQTHAEQLQRDLDEARAELEHWKGANLYPATYREAVERAEAAEAETARWKAMCGFRRERQKAAEAQAGEWKDRHDAVKWWREAAEQGRDEARAEVVRLAGRTEQLDDALEDAHNAAITFQAQAATYRAIFRELAPVIQQVAEWLQSPEVPLDDVLTSLESVAEMCSAALAEEKR